MKKGLTYLPHDFSTGWPLADDLFYECQKCGTVVPSTQGGQCKCGNIYVDVGYGRAGAADEAKVRLVKKHYTL
jgi:hypothetical protein